MKVSASAPLTPGRKADHPVKDLVPAQPQKRPAWVRCETLNPQASPHRVISALKARPGKASSAPPAEINALRRPDAWAQPPEALSSPAPVAPAVPPTLKLDRQANQISIAPADSPCKKRNPAAPQRCNSHPTKRISIQNKKGESITKSARLLFFNRGYGVRCGCFVGLTIPLFAKLKHRHLTANANYD
jgi:hypothetical protein